MQKKLTEVHIGEIFKHKVLVNDTGRKYVLYGIVIRETPSSMCYDRDYKVIPLDTLAKYENVDLEPDELEKLIHLITLKGVEAPMVEACHEAPFKFEAINLVKIGRKKKVESIHWI